jgi:hypothetical protein
MLNRFLVAMLALSVLAAMSCLAQSQVTQSDTFAAQSAIMSGKSSARQIATLKVVPSVGRVYLPNRIVRSGEAYIQWKLSSEKNAAGIVKLRRALRGNPVTKAALATRGIPFDHVVGVKISSGGSLRLYLLR